MKFQVTFFVSVIQIIVYMTNTIFSLYSEYIYKLIGTSNKPPKLSQAREYKSRQAM